MKNNAGFSLIEMLVVISIVATISTILLVNFSRSKVGVDHTAAVVTAQIREVQTMATSGVKFKAPSDSEPKHRCGYGITPVDTRQFSIYTSPDASSGLLNCSLQNRNYEAGTDVVVKNFVITDPKVEMKAVGPSGVFTPIFFEPPDPKTYIDNSAAPSTTPSQIRVGRIDVSCGDDPLSCTTICVYTSGKIETVGGVVCP